MPDAVNQTEEKPKKEEKKKTELKAPEGVDMSEFEEGGYTKEELEKILEAYESSLVGIEEGKVITGKVVKITDDEVFVRADLSDLDEIAKATNGVDGIIHLGGFSVEGSWEEILQANIVGCRNLYEAARLSGVERVVFASSNHAVGFYRRDQTIGVDVTVRPDSRYGVSKVFGESMGALYADKYGLRVMAIRIGNVDRKPIDARRLAIWISPRDLAQLVIIGLEHPDLGFEIVYGMSDNARAWWDNSNALQLGYVPQDHSEVFAEEVLRDQSADTGDPVADAHQGGTFVSVEEGGGPPPPKFP